MTEPLLDFVLLGAATAASIGCARIVSWLLARRDFTASQQSREAAFGSFLLSASVAQARAELAVWGWSAEGEAAFQAIRAQQGVSLKLLQEARGTPEPSPHALVEVGKRPMGTFPETPPYPASF